MTPDERSLLKQFLADLSAAHAATKDAEADGMIRETLSANADAAYLLVQHAIVADQSLHAAQARIADLEQQLRNGAPQPASMSFLGSARGPWGSTDAAPASPPSARPGFFSGESGLGSFLRNAGTTAAGVAGGEALFSGLHDLFGGHSGGDALSGNGGGETIINNYDDNRFESADDDDALADTGDS